MDRDVKGNSPGKRGYHSPRRVEQAAETRRAILAAARELFVGSGYAATTVGADRRPGKGFRGHRLCHGRS